MNLLRMFFGEIAMVLLVGVVVGAGLPAIFAIGIRGLAYGAGGDAEISHEKGHPIGKLVAALCFGVVLLVIAMGITIVVSSGLGYKVDFGTGLPTFSHK